MKFQLFLAAVLAVGFSFQSCKKVEGPGGSSTIKGKVFATKQSNGNTYFLANEDVYIIYGGSDSFYDDRVKTSYDGSFEFNFLRKGTYQVFVYSDCNGADCPSGEEHKLVSVNISKNKSTEDIGTINVVK